MQSQKIISSVVISKHTKSNTAVVQQVAQVIKHGFLVMAADSAKIAQETAAVGHHLWKPDFLMGSKFVSYMRLHHIDNFNICV